MTSAHWKHQNHFIHNGKGGFDMFSTGYAARIDDEERPQAAFEFDDVASASSLGTMLDQIPQVLAQAGDGKRFRDFFVERVNTTPATEAMVEEAVLRLVRERAVEVVGDNGSLRHVKKAIKADHVIRLPEQRPLIFLGR